MDGVTDWKPCEEVVRPLGRVLSREDGCGFGIHKNDNPEWHRQRWHYDVPADLITVPKHVNL